MESKSTNPPNFVKSALIILGLSVICFFTMRHFYIERIWVNYKTVRLEWDASDVFTMNIFAVVFFLLFFIVRLLLSYIEFNSLKVIFDVLCGISLGDLINRYVGIYWYIPDEDNPLLLECIATALVWFLISNRQKLFSWISKICR